MSDQIADAMLTEQPPIVAPLPKRRRFTSRWRRAPTIVVPTTMVGLIAVAALVGPLLTPYDPIATDLTRTLLPPGRAHWLGTDQFGRDVLTRIVYAIGVDLLIVGVGTGISFVLGLLLGCLAGYCGGWIDALIGRLIDVLIAVPYLALVMAIVAVLGPGVKTIYVAIALVGWVVYARIMRAQILVARSQPYIEAARALGISHLGILGRHLLPNTITAALVYAMSAMVLNLQLLAALSFLGLGVQPPTPDLGAMIAEGQTFLLDAPGLSTWPGLAVALVGLSFSVLGDGLADLLRPHSE